MKHWLALSLCAVMALPAWAKPVKSEEQAVDLVVKSVKKHQRTLLNLKLSCVSFMVSDENADRYFVDIREKHDSRCGGDPETSPRLFSYEVKKQTGKLCTDNWTHAEKLGVDPTAMQCNPIN